MQQKSSKFKFEISENQGRFLSYSSKAIQNCLQSRIHGPIPPAQPKNETHTEMQIKKFPESELTQELALGIARVAGRSFKSSRTIEERVLEMMSDKDPNSLEFMTGRRYIIANDDGLIVAHARTFVREIKTELNDQTVPVMALASVCSDPDVRGQGLGSQVTKLAFELVGKDGWPALSLFQTPVPVFYEKLNCRIVKNKFVNRTNTDAPDAWPWRDDIVMIHPGSANWPDGIIDINGPDY